MTPPRDRTRREHVAVYAGSFDPITLGHLDVVGRARRLFDRLVLGIGQNPDKVSLFSFEERVEMAQALIDEMLEVEPDGAPVTVQHYTGLTVDFAKQCDASAILRGIRNITDLASEFQLAITNRQVADIETLFIMTGEAFGYTSSSLIRQVAAMGGAVERLNSIVPPLVIRRLQEKQRDPSSPLRRMVKDAFVE